MLSRERRGRRTALTLFFSKRDVRHWSEPCLVTCGSEVSQVSGSWPLPLAGDESEENGRPDQKPNRTLPRSLSTSFGQRVAPSGGDKSQDTTRDLVSDVLGHVGGPETRSTASGGRLESLSANFGVSSGGVELARRKSSTK